MSAAALAALRADPSGWGERPVFVYGFDDLARDQAELIGELARSASVTVAVTYADSRALAARAGLLTRLIDEFGARPSEPLPFDPSYTSSATLRHLDRSLFEPGAAPIDADDGLVLLDSAGPRGEAEAIGIEIARLLADGYAADEIAIVLRYPDSSGAVLASVLTTLGIPVALEASIPVTATCVGTSLVALCRAAEDETAVESLLTHLRTDPAMEPGAIDWVERRIRRGRAETVTAATETWASPPRHLERLRAAPDRVARLRALARSARELAEGAHRQASAARTRLGPGGRRRPVLGAGAARGRRCRRAAHGARRPRRAGRGATARPRRGDRGARGGDRSPLAGAGLGTGADHEPLPGARRPRARAVLRRAAGGRVPERSATGPAAVGGAARRARQPRPAPRRSAR